MIEALLTGAVALARDGGPAVLWSAALVGGVAYAVRSARRCGLDPREAYWAATLAVVVGLVGSRLLGMVVYRAAGPLGWREILGGGHSYYGGLLGGSAAALACLRLRGLDVWRHADALTPACALGYAVGRVGCFLNGDDYGVVVRGALAVRYPPATEAFAAQVARGLVAPSAALSLPVLPIQLLHAALGLSLFLLLRRPAGAPGRRVGLFAVGYGAGRFALELGRGDFGAAVGPLSLHQALSLGVVAAGVVLLARVRGGAPGAAAAAATAELS